MPIKVKSNYLILLIYDDSGEFQPVARFPDKIISPWPLTNTQPFARHEIRLQKNYGVRGWDRMNRLLARSIAVLGIAVTAAGCTAIPESGPARRDVEANATIALLGTAPVFSYALVDLNRNILPFIVDPGAGSLFRTFGTGRGPAPEIRVGVGDTVQVTLFEAQAGGLFIPADAGSRPGNFVTLPAETVDSKGYITVPYAGQIYALNRSQPAIQQEIVDKLVNRSIEPQAIVAITSQTSTQVTVVGEVNNPNKISINPAGDRVLDAISRVGGIRDPGYETFVTLQRHGLKGTVYFLTLLKDAKENIFVQPGDILYVYQYQRAFMAYGATGLNGQFKFQQENVTLNDAVGKAGGLLDNRSDPGQIFVYRLENHTALAKMGADISLFPEYQALIPTIYRVNFRDPSGYFAASRFPMRDGDVLYVDNADQVELTKFLSMITTVTGSVSTVASDASITKDAITNLKH